ncbi:hypothetical protein [Desulfovibrio sp. TomC]|uniref:hypothetical protein n=1 Tax=Desulfovibrio sp. TomC TaxID=1562888 RepID=UPI0005738E6F|nr:hypothetical protein [Desulfovibrio sp. TomC]KHK03040.1 NADPH-dependent FMN reductase [Desulfovibrio sp. TomC]
MAATWLVLDALGGEGGGRAAIGLAVRQQAALVGVRLDVACLPETDVAPCRGWFGCAASKGATVHLVHLARMSGDAEALVELADQRDRVDGVCLTYPLYADQLPGQVLEVLAWLAERRREIPPAKPQRFFAVANCGFPEAVDNDGSLEMCRLFAAEAGFAWMGGCAVGGGGLYEGRALASLGWLGRRARTALA